MGGDDAYVRDLLAHLGEPARRHVVASSHADGAVRVAAWRELLAGDDTALALALDRACAGRSAGEAGGEPAPDEGAAMRLAARRLLARARRGEGTAGAEDEPFERLALAASLRALGICARGDDAPAVGAARPPIGAAPDVVLAWVSAAGCVLAQTFDRPLLAGLNHFADPSDFFALPPGLRAAAVLALGASPTHEARDALRRVAAGAPAEVALAAYARLAAQGVLDDEAAVRARALLEGAPPGVAGAHGAELRRAFARGPHPYSGEHVVLLNEEFFCACWYWYPGMSPAETAHWWRSVDDWRIFFGKRLPGRLVVARGDGAFVGAYRARAFWTAHAHVGDDSLLFPPGGGGPVLPRCHPDATPE
jgi:hypothetical protein